MVSNEPNALDVAVHRARKQLAQAGLVCRQIELEGVHFGRIEGSPLKQ
jgi:hypothetical protein